MANRFWVGGGSSNTWAATANTNWAATSGGALNATVPGVGDIAIFDSNSGVSSSVIGTSVAVQGVECDGNAIGTGAYAGTLSINSAIVLTINTGAASSFRLSAGMTFSPNSSAGALTFTNTSGIAQLKSYGKTMGSVTINGVGGTVQLQDNFTAPASISGTNAITLTNGTFDANNFSVSVPNFSGTNSNTRTLTMGSGNWTITRASGNANVFDLGTTTGLTFNKGSGTILIGGATSAASLNFSGGGLTFNNITFVSPTSGVSQYSRVIGANTFATFTIQPGCSVGLPAATIPMTSLVLAGTAVAPIRFGTDLMAAAPTSVTTISIASGIISATWCDLNMLTATGGATFNATNSFNGGGLSGWNITPPVDAALSAASIAAAVWQDATAGDFTVAGSIGKDVKTGALPGAAGGLFIAGTNAATTITTSLTTTLAGNVGGNVLGSVGSVIAPVAVMSNVKKNQALSGFMFTMTDSTNHNPKTGLSVTAQVAHDSGAFASTTNVVTELADGDYALNLSAADLNANNVMLRFTATNADDLNILIVTQP